MSDIMSAFRAEQPPKTAATAVIAAAATRL